MIIIAESKEENALVERLAKEHGARGVMREDGYAVTMWSVADVKEKHKTISAESAEEFLEYYESRLRESSISGGWDFIDYADVSDYEDIITAEMIDDALFDDVIVPKREEDGLKAYIGEDWFYFGGSEFEHTEPPSIPCKELVNEIKVALEALKGTPEGKKEYLFYLDFIKQELQKK